MVPSKERLRAELSRLRKQVKRLEQRMEDDDDDDDEDDDDCVQPSLRDLLAPSISSRPQTLSHSREPRSLESVARQPLLTPTSLRTSGSKRRREQEEEENKEEEEKEEETPPFKTAAAVATSGATARSSSEQSRPKQVGGAGPRSVQSVNQYVRTGIALPESYPRVEVAHLPGHDMSPDSVRALQCSDAASGEGCSSATHHVRFSFSKPVRSFALRILPL